jgi:hypothetical protein
MDGVEEAGSFGGDHVIPLYLSSVAAIKAACHFKEELVSVHFSPEKRTDTNFTQKRELTPILPTSAPHQSYQDSEARLDRERATRGL